jgi:uncharacterized membrane protein
MLIPRGLVWAFVIISFLGFLDATFLTAEHYLGSLLSCPIFGGCDKVLTSFYSAVGGIPVALAGAVYYLAIFILGIAYFDIGRARILKFAANLTPLGLIASLWFLYLQLFVIKALCFYCLVSALISTLLFILALLLRRKIAVPASNLLE